MSKRAAYKNHWSERGRAVSVANADALDRPRRSVLTLGGRRLSSMDTLQPRKRFLVAAILLCFAVPHSVAAELRRNYEHGEALSRDQEQAVLRLVKRVGVTNVAEIYTFFIIPSPDRGIGVIEGDTVRNNEASYRRIIVGYQPWERGVDREKHSIKEGPYWIENIMQEKRLLFAVGTNSYRVRPFDKSLSMKQRIAFDQ